MLIVDLVIGGLLDDVAEVRFFKNKNPFGGQKVLQTLYDSADIGQVAHDVGTEDGVGGAVLGKNIAVCRFIKESADRIDALFACGFSHVGGGFDPDMAQACLREMLQHDAIIGADFDHQRIGIGQIIRAHRVGELAKMLRHSSRN